MTVRREHVPMDRLTALAFGIRAPESDQDRDAFAHISRCDRCRDALARVTSDAEDLREAACAEADRAFDEAMLDTQRARILDRLAHLGQAARVLRFPARARGIARPVSAGGRRWITVAAAAGLIIGLVAGQLVHVVPWDARTERDHVGSTVQAPRQSGLPVLRPASATTPTLSDDELLDEIEAAVQLRRAQSLRVLDALTPTAADIRDRSRGR